MHLDEKRFFRVGKKNQAIIGGPSCGKNRSSALALLVRKTRQNGKNEFVVGVTCTCMDSLLVESHTNFEPSDIPNLDETPGRGTGYDRLCVGYI